MAVRVAFIAICVLGVAHSGNAQTSIPVTWTNMVNVAASATLLQKTGGCDGCQDAGAVSEQQLSADGYIEFTVGELNTLWMAGLSHGDSDQTYADIDFGFRFNGGGYADVLENGNYGGGDTTYAAGDVFRITLSNGRITYSKNGRYLKESAATPQLPLVFDTSLISAGASIRNASLGVMPPPPPGGGLLEKSGSPALRRRFTAAEIASFLPAGGATGPFEFPAPYHTQGVRLTNDRLCAGGADCLWYVGYSYWRNINNHVGSNDMYVFVGTDPNRGGAGPQLIRVNKATDEVTIVGPLFAPNSPYYWSTAEGWYFSGSQPTTLYTLLPGTAVLRRFDVLTRQFEPAPAMDLSACPRPRICPKTAAFLIQAHSSDDDLVHSASVQDVNWRRIGCVVSRPSGFLYYASPPGVRYDECHIDKSGRWLVLIETRRSGTRINRVIDTITGRHTTIDDVNGALGHFDMGYGYAVGADTYNPLPNATIVVTFPVESKHRPIGPVVHYNKRWDIAAANHVAHGNAAAGIPLASQFACGSNASTVPDMADEIVCFPLDSTRSADGSLDVLVVGQVMTDVYAAGGGADDYSKRPKGNLDVTGRYFVWTSNLGGSRLDLLLVKIPAQRLSAVATAR